MNYKKKIKYVWPTLGDAKSLWSIYRQIDELGKKVVSLGLPQAKALNEFLIILESYNVNAEYKIRATKTSIKKEIQFGYSNNPQVPLVYLKTLISKQENLIKDRAVYDWYECKKLLRGIIVGSYLGGPSPRSFPRVRRSTRKFLKKRLYRFKGRD